MQTPQAGVHSDADVEAQVRPMAAGDLSCPAEQLMVQSVRPETYGVQGCGARAVYCCYQRSLEVFCERQGQGRNGVARACHDEELAEVPEVQRPIPAEDYVQGL